MQVTTERSLHPGAFAVSKDLEVRLSLATHTVSKKAIQVHSQAQEHVRGNKTQANLTHSVPMHIHQRVEQLAASIPTFQ